MGEFEIEIDFTPRIPKPIKRMFYRVTALYYRWKMERDLRKATKAIEESRKQINEIIDSIKKNGMTGKYDVRCEQCDECGMLEHDHYPNGEPCDVCRQYGYILHSKLGISPDECKGFTKKTLADMIKESEMKKQNKKRRRI